MADQLPTKPQGTWLISKDPEYDAWLANVPEEKLKRIRAGNASRRTGLHSVAPLTCSGPEECPFIAHCPIPSRNEDGSQNWGKLSDYPMHRSCVMERLYMETKIEEYAVYLKVDPDNPIEVSIVNDLALIDLYKNRAMMILSSGDRDGHGIDFLKTDITNFTPNGTPLTSTQIHPASDMIERLEKRRERLLDKLIETRMGRVNAQAKLGVTDGRNRVLEELQAVKELLQSQSESLQLLPDFEDEEIKIK